MILFSFLGMGPYQRAAYVWTDPAGAPRRHTAVYATTAMAAFLQPDRVVLLATPEARALHLDALRAELGGGVPHEVIDITAGHSEDELWGLFATIADRVPPGEPLALDVTHGFRSLPMVALLAAGYLQAARRAHVEHVLYGAWEARGDGDPPNTPVFDLTPMFALTAWAAAADRFARSGDSRDLASLLQTAARGPLADADPRGKQNSLAKTLRETSLALYLTQPLRAMHAARLLDLRLREMEGRYPLRATPFLGITQDVRAAYAPLAMENPRDPASVPRILTVQRDLVHWYYDRELYVQAASLAREWVVSWRVAWRGGKDLVLNAARSEAEVELGCLIDAQKHGRVRVDLEGVPDGIDLSTLWNRLAFVRNAMCHGGMSRNDPQPQTLVDTLHSLVSQIDALPIPGEEQRTI